MSGGQIADDADHCPRAAWERLKLKVKLSLYNSRLWLRIVPLILDR